ncbi:MAG: spore germination protein [Oscillospiraceae bacterium]
MIKNQTVFKNHYTDHRQILNEKLRVSESFDVIGKEMVIGSRKAVLYLVDGFVKDDIMEHVMEFLLSVPEESISPTETAKDFSARMIPYIETDVTTDYDAIVTAVLSGTLALILEGMDACVLIDARTYPVRAVSEPEDDRVLRGAHDGFVETLVFNTSLIRRRIRDPQLTMDIMQIGDKSKTDVVVCYLQNKVHMHLLKEIKKKLREIDIHTLTMGQESLAECLIKPQWWNPFPRIRYTERPDAASASIMEGNVLIIVDNSPSVMIFPTSLFDFVQDANDFYFPPLVGSYLRAVRMIVFLLTLLLTPIWYLLIKNPDFIPSWLEFIKVETPNAVPILAQLLIVELVIDGLKLASLNTPSVLNNSFSVVGALILGDFAVRANWFIPEVVLYMAFVAIAGFTQPSFELGYALKFFRVILLVLTALLNLWGFGAGILLLIVALCCTRTIDGRKYLYPLIPFNGKALLSLLLRRPLKKSKN